MFSFILRVIILALLISFFSVLVRVVRGLFHSRLRQRGGNGASSTGTRKDARTIVLEKDEYHVE